MRRIACALAVMSLGLAACGGSGTDDMVRSGTVPVEQKADGRLLSNPAPLTIADIEKQPRRSARRAVLQLIFWAQWGNLPAVVDIYDRRVVEALGVTRITGPYDYLRPELLTAQPRIIATRPSGAGEFVSIELASTRGAPVREGFLMLRRDGAWRVVYDTLLERGLETFATTQRDPGDETPSISARRAGTRASQLYRDIHPSQTLAQRLRAAR